jgi:exonuclease VII large subunit
MAYVADNYEAVRTLRAFGCPVFTAIGHAKNMTLLDKYADDAFATPTAFSNCLTTAFKVVNRQMPVADKAIKIAPLDHSIPQKRWLTRHGFHGAYCSCWLA